MSQKTRLEKIKNCDFFNGFDEDHLNRLADICELQEFPARSSVFEEDDRARRVYVLLSGQVSLVICEPEDSCKQIAVVHAGDLMGWSPLVGRTRLYDSAHSLTPVTALVFDGDALMDFCAKNPTFGFRFMHRVACTLAERLSGTRIQLLEMCGIHLPEVPIESD